MGASDLERGARIDVRLAGVEAGVGTYSGVLALAAGAPTASSLVIQLRCVDPAEVQVEGDAPEWAVSWVAGLGRQARRSASTTGNWPRRIRQWRAPSSEG